MRVLFISNHNAARCGVAEYGRIWVKELRRQGVEIVEWDGSYEAVVKNGYVPWDADAYDIVHLNWDPQTINHYLPQHFRGLRPLSLFLHDDTAHSTCPVFDVAKLRMGYVSEPGVIQVDHAVPAYYGPFYRHAPGAPVSIGVTGIRDDPGAELVQEVCERRGWQFMPPTWWPETPQHARVWQQTDAEIMRLATCTVNVCWYHTSGRGKSMAAMFCVAARRPLLLSGSTMFSNLWQFPYHDRGVTIVRDTHSGGVVHEGAWRRKLEPELEVLVRNSQLGQEYVPDVAARELAWTHTARQIKSLWEGMIR